MVHSAFPSSPSGLSPLPVNELVETGRRMVAHSLVQATAGNISIQCNKTVYISASGYALGALSEDLIAQLELSGDRLDTNPCHPSSEWPIHQAIYQANPDVGAIIHSHPIAATARAIAHQPLTTPYVAEAMVLLGPVPVLPYRQPGSDALAQQVAQALTRYRAVMLANHGVVVIGTNMQDAYYRLELLEATAHMVNVAGQQAVPLTPQQVTTVWAKYGDGSSRHRFAERVFLDNTPKAV